MSRANQSAINRRAGGQQMPPSQMQQRQTVGISSQQMMQQQQQQQRMVQQPQMASPYKQQQPGQGPMKSVSFQDPYQDHISQQQQQQQQTQQPPRKGKITVSDAIALTTLRLGRVEQIVEQWQNEGHNPRGDLNPDGSVSTEPSVDPSVIMSLISRIENLEKRPVTQSSSSAFDIKPTDDKIESLKQEIISLKKIVSTITQEMSQIKENAMKLQMFTMETNQKLINAVMSKPPPVPFGRLVTPVLDHQEEVIGGETLIDNSYLNNDFEYSPNVEDSIDLKEYIKNEFVPQEISCENGQLFTENV